MSLRVVFAGTPHFALPALTALAQRHDVVAVYTQPDRPAGRGRTRSATPVKALAQSLDIEVAQPATLRDDDVLAQLARSAPDVMVVVAYGLLLPQAALDLPRYGCLNIHASLLPRWRGAAPIQRAILAGDTETGVTIMRMEAGLDTGPMLLKAALPIGATTTAAQLHDDLAALGAQLIVDALAQLPNGQLVGQAQDEAEATQAPKLSKAEAAIDWTGSGAEIDRRIRAFNPWPVAQTTFRMEPLQLLGSRLLPGRQAQPDVPPGSVLGLVDGALEVVCGDTVIGITELRRAGRGRVSAADFANAQHIGRVVAPGDMVFG